MAAPTLTMRSIGELFPGIERTEIEFRRFGFPYLGLGHAVSCPTSLVVLCLIVRHLKCQRIFEFGTNLGLGTYQLAVNSVPEATIYTLDVDGDDFFAGSPRLRGVAKASDLVGMHFKNTEYAGKVKQQWGNSRSFDFSPFLGSMDCVYVDGDHSYDGIRWDTEVAFGLLSKKGVIVWDDYIKLKPVTQYLEELATDLPVFHVHGTEVAVYLKGFAAN